MSTSPPALTFPVLIGDIGGTNARFQVIETLETQIRDLPRQKTDDFPGELGVQRAIEAARAAGGLETSPKTAILAAAGPITETGIELTNCDWVINAARFLADGPFETLILMNDFEAQALALPVLEPQDLASVGGPSVAPPLTGTRAVLGPGTGLGIGLLIEANETWVPLPAEGGHVDLGPRSARENAIWAHLDQIEGRISAEQIVSGRGLLNLYRACCRSNDRTPTLERQEDITAAALAKADMMAVSTLELFCTCLGRIAGDLTLTSMAKGGTYITGGVAQQIAGFLPTSGFRASFEDKAPHTQLMQRIPTWLITCAEPALIGLASFVRQPERYLMSLDHRTWHRSQ